MESDKKLTGSKLVPELTKNKNSSEKATGIEGKPGPSMASKTASGKEMESKPSTSAPEIACKKADLEKIKRASDPTGEFSPTKKSKLKGFFSTTKDSKDKTGTKRKECRSKSVPPYNKSLISKDIVNPEACISENSEHINEGGEKTGLWEFFETRWKKFKTKRSSSVPSETETATLVDNAEIDQTENTPPPKIKIPEEKLIEIDEIDAGLDKSMDEEEWIGEKSLLSEKHTHDATTITDDIAPACAARPSETGDNTSADVDSSILDSSTEEKPPAVQDDKYFYLFD